EHLEVLRRIGDRARGLPGQALYGPRALGEQVQQLDALGRGHGFTQPPKLLVDRVLEPTVGRHRIQVFKRLLDLSRPRSDVGATAFEAKHTSGLEDYVEYAQNPSRKSKIRSPDVSFQPALTHGIHVSSFASCVNNTLSWP